MKQAPFLWDLRAFMELYRRGQRRKITCNICGVSSIFRFYGYPIRLNSLCTNCESLDRHRLVKLYFDQNPGDMAGKQFLHFAPERCLRRVIEPKCAKYVGCDYNPTGDLIKINIEKIDQPDAHFDTIMCSNVLEHVDDTKALPELFRILRPGGKLLLLFPIVEGWDQTFEDPTIVSEFGRLDAFGQEDHIRYYGRDVRDRIRAAGFKLSEFTAVEPHVRQLGLLRGEKIFVCAK